MTRAALPLLLVLLLGLGPAARADSGEAGGVHLLAGARHFRDGRYAAALAEFQQAERQGVGAEATWYVAATLLRLGRAEEALEAFEAAEAGAPEARDGVLAYYQALACYELRAYRCADALLARVGQEGGPQVQAHTARMRQDLAPVLAAAPSRTAAAWYRARAAQAERQGRPALARRWRAEAAALAPTPSSQARSPTAAAGRAP